MNCQAIWWKMIWIIPIRNWFAENIHQISSAFKSYPKDNYVEWQVNEVLGIVTEPRVEYHRKKEDAINWPL